MSMNDLTGLEIIALLEQFKNSNFSPCEVLFENTELMRK